MKHIYACTTCGSQEVLRDAWAAWDVDAQDWVLRQTFDDAYCQECDGPTKIESINILDNGLEVF